MKTQIVGLFLCLILLVTLSSAAAEEPWTEVRSPHFRVLTNGDASDAKHVAADLEQMRYVFETQFPGFRLDSGAPLTIFAARDERTAKMLEPEMRKIKGTANLGGLFKHGWEKQYAMVRLDVRELSSNVLVYHEYTHTILHLNFHWLPTWLDEGIAEFYSYTRFEQHKTILGAPTERVRILSNTPVPIRTLISEQNPLFGGDGDKTEMFYAESWALVHYMMFGDGMDRGRKLNEFFGLLQNGADQTKAFEQVFGSPEAMDRPFDQYMRNLAFHAAVMPSSPDIKEKDFRTRKLSLAETEAELAGYHLWSRDPESAAPLIAAALAHDPKLGLAHEEDGFLLFNSGKDSEAAAEFSQAYALDPTLYLSLFARTMLSPTTNSNAPADEAALYAALMKVADLNPQFAPAFVQLARLDLREGNQKAAFGVARRAEELEPSRAGYHLLTGEILRRMGKNAEAAQFAEYVAKHWPATDHNEAVELWNRVPAPARPAGVSLAIEKPANTQTATGIVKSSTCDAGAKQPWTLVLDDNGKEQTFHRTGRLGTGFSDTLWWGEDHFNICRHLVGLRAVVRYSPSADRTFTGNVVDLGIRDDLPPPSTSNTGLRQIAKQ